MPYLTGDTLPSASICRRLSIPDEPLFREAVSGALELLAYPSNWEQFGSGTPADYADAAFRMWLAFVSEESACMIGACVPYATGSSPDGTLDCDGSTYLRVDYPLLYDALSVVFKVDADHFTVPDLRGRTVISTGTGEGLSPRSIGDSIGEESHTLDVTEMPTHSHTDTGHIHPLAGEFPGLALSPGELPVDVPGSGEFTGVGNASLTNTGSGFAHNNIQPSYALKYCIIAR